MINKQELMFGIHPIREALKSKKRHIFELYIVKDKAKSRIVDEVIKMAKAANVIIKSVEAKVLDSMVNGQNHQGLIARAEPLKTLRLSDAIYQAQGKKELWLALDEVTDPQNLGAMLRSAACLGFSTVLLPKHRTVGITPAVHKVACGALETLNIVEVSNLNTAILDLKDEGFWVYGADMAGKDIKHFSYAYPALLVIGSEGTGLREKTKEHCDDIIAIKQKGGVSSLNASASAAIIMYDISSKLGD